jgi:hypothetical protein
MFGTLVSKIAPFFKIAWKNNVKPDKPQITIWCARITCWIPKATNTYPEYVIRIAFPLQQLMHELASVLHHKYVCSVMHTVNNIIKAFLFTN